MAGLYSGSHTAQVVRGNWYKVRVILSRSLMVDLHKLSELAISPRADTQPGIPVRVDWIVYRYISK